MMLDFFVAGNLLVEAWLLIRGSPGSKFATVAKAAVLMNSLRFNICAI